MTRLDPASDHLAALIVLTKAPVAGTVKTRLCPPATPEQAADLAAAAMLDVLDTVRAVPRVRPILALAGRLCEAARAEELSAMAAAMTMLPQRGNGLGARIAAAHGDAAELAPGRPTLQISTDTPQVDPDLLGDGLVSLLAPGVDAVLGPTADGGWWALGLRDPRLAALIATVPTSRSDTGERTLTVLRRTGLRVALLPQLTDVDTMAEVAEVTANLAGSSSGRRFVAASAKLLEARHAAAQASES